jgi:hypothetical protein
LEQFAPAVALEPVSLSLPNLQVGLRAWEDRAFYPSVTLTRRVLPTADMEGFFLARFRKHAPGPAAAQPARHEKGQTLPEAEKTSGPPLSGNRA